MQDFTGVPAVVDLAAMRAAMAKDRAVIRVKLIRLCPVDLVIDHSVQVDRYLAMPKHLKTMSNLKLNAITSVINF